MKVLVWVLVAVAAMGPVSAGAMEIKVSASALERTLDQQLFSGPDGRFYIKGKDGAACFVYVQEPKVSFLDDRVVVHVKTRSKLGAGVFGKCVGVSLATDADVSVIPEAEGESIGFRDARVDNLSASKELSFLLVPFLTRKLPGQMKINAADLVKTLLGQSARVTGYDVQLDNLKIYSMHVEDGALVVDFDGDFSVQ
jgi:hypothetical protein